MRVRVRGLGFEWPQGARVTCASLSGPMQHKGEGEVEGEDSDIRVSWSGSGLWPDLRLVEWSHATQAVEVDLEVLLRLLEEIAYAVEGCGEGGSECEGEGVGEWGVKV